VALSGRMGERALLVIDGQSQLLSPGQSAAGVRLLRWQGDEAIVERDGRTSALRVGGAPVALGGAVAQEAASEVVISAGLGGHFSVDGAINGRAVRFMVDTGATVVALGRDDAARLGLDLSRAVPVMMGTANGSVRAQRIVLARVRVGGIELTQVEAVVLPAAMPSVLLGNSFLSRLQMRRENDVMRLQRR
jgi:aspartyl protease family protein